MALQIGYYSSLSDQARFASAYDCERIEYVGRALNSGLENTDSHGDTRVMPWDSVDSLLPLVALSFPHTVLFL